MKNLALATLISLACGTTALASGDHDHEAAVEAAPHGGILRNAAPYKAELVLKKDNAKVYVYDDKMKPVAKEKLKPSIKGELGFPKDKKKKQVTFDLKSDAYEATLAGIGKVHRYDLHITLEVDGKPILADFGVDNIH